LGKKYEKMKKGKNEKKGKERKERKERIEGRKGGKFEETRLFLSHAWKTASFVACEYWTS
jgi:hypothetical protein